MKKTLTLPSANILYLITMFLVLIIGSVMQVFSLTLGLIGTEFLLILLPALLFLRSRKIPLREGLRLKSLSWSTALLCLLLGIGTWLISMFIEGLMMRFSGLSSVNISESMLPKGALQLALYFFAIAISAPICEEVLFRGAIQGAYENHRSKWFAITITALMFAFYHFRLSGLPALIPVAFLLGYVVWRTQSLFAGMLIHFGMNASAAVNTIVSLSVDGFVFPLTSLYVLLGGLLVAGFALVLLIRRVSAPIALETLPLEADAAAVSAPGVVLQAAPVAQPVAAPPSKLRTYWPLGAAFFLYLAVAFLTLIPVLFPELTAQEGVTFNPAKWTQVTSNHYQITNRSGDVVGEANCRVEPGTETVQLHCKREVRAYDITVGQSRFIEGDSVVEWSAKWDAKTMEMEDYSYTMQINGKQATLAQVKDGALVVNIPEGSQQAALPEHSLLQQEWPWRCGHLTVMSGITYKVPFAYRMHWNNQLEKSQPEVETELLRAFPLEKLTVPMGSYDTWKVTIGDEAAWYSINDPTLIVQYDDGMVTYSLK